APTAAPATVPMAVPLIVLSLSPKEAQPLKAPAARAAAIPKCISFMETSQEGGSGHKAPRPKLAERKGFEPLIPFWSIHTFQACAFDHSATSPRGPVRCAKTRQNPSGGAKVQGALHPKNAKGYLGVSGGSIRIDPLEGVVIKSIPCPASWTKVLPSIWSPE